MRGTRQGKLRGDRPRILVADDDPDARRMYRTYLRAVGCTVRTASNGLAAVHSATEHRPHAIVMDLAMPLLDGWAATEKLRRQRSTRSIPIVALSCVEFARARARAAGCDAFLAKPCLPELLWWQLRVILEEHARRASRPARMRVARKSPSTGQR